MRKIALIAILFAGYGACTCSAGEAGTAAALPLANPPRFAEGLALPDPEDLHSTSSTAPSGSVLLGAGSDAALPGAATSASGFTRSFAPPVSASTDGLAYACYRYVLDTAPSEGTVVLHWVGGAPASGVWVGLANWEARRWDWSAANTLGEAGFADLAPYFAEDGELVAAVVYFLARGASPQAATLGWISVGGTPNEAGALYWGEPLEIAVSGEITTAFNNAQPVLRTRDLEQLFIGYRADDGLHLALIEDGAVTADDVVSILPNAAGLTIDERPGSSGEIWIGYTYPGGVVLRQSLDHGASFSAESDLPGSGALPAAVSLSFGDDGAGYALWHAGSPDTQVASARLEAASSTWGAGAVLETLYSPSAFACVWARGGNALGVWRSDTVAGAGQAWKVRCAEHDGAGWGGISTVGGATMNYDPSVVRLADSSVALAYFEIGQTLHLYTAPSAADPFAESYGPPDFGRFPGLRSNGAGVMALTYEYQAAPGDNHDNTIKECGLSVSFDGGASWLHRACDTALIGAKSRIYSHAWLGEPSGYNAGQLDFIWIDASAAPQKLYLQSAEAVVF